jgi:acyl-coenzyme A thioesterase PaaI-like protein
METKKEAKQGAKSGEFTPEQNRELLRVMDGLRRAIEASVSLRAPAGDLSALADETHALADALHARSGDKPIPRYGRGLDPRDPNLMIAYSPITGRYNPLAPPVEITLEPGPPPRVVGAITFGDAYEGPPACVHGSIIASVYDQVLALAAIANDAGGPTATLTIHFRRLTPLRTPLRFEAWIERIDGRKAFARGTCHAGGELVSESEGMFVSIRR